MLQIRRQEGTTSESQAPSASSLLEGGLADSEVGRVYSQIFDAVVDRRLLPGTKLTEATLCTIFECSRATVRAALAALEHDKIVVIEPNRGAFIWKPTAKQTRDVFELRRDLEALILKKLISFPDLPERLAGLYELVEREQHAFEHGDRISWLRLSNAFHVMLARCAGNDELTELMHTLCARTTLIIAYHDTPGEQACSFYEHKEILDKLSQGDADGAHLAMHHHLSDCEHRMSEAGDGSAADPWLALSVKR